MQFSIRPVGHELDAALRHKIDNKTKPLGSLGLLERIALKVGRIQNSLSPEFAHPLPELTTMTKPDSAGSADAKETFDYSQTLFLPQTAFPMRAGLPQKEPELLKAWEEGDLYGKLRQAAASPVA